MKLIDIDLDYSVMNLLKVAAYLHSKSGNNIEHFIEECKWAYEHGVKDEDN